jgi:CRP/FNR family transcriptional regulator, dissimilatory nitrate respiration regulator
MIGLAENKEIGCAATVEKQEMATDDTTIVMRAPLFQAMGPDITHSIIQNRTARRYDRGERVFQQGDPAESFFLVVEGWVKLYREREDGDQVVVAIFTAGETFAEVAMFLGGRYPATAEVVSPARILRIDGAALRRAIVQKPQLAFDMLAAASLHLKRLVLQVEQLKAQSAPQRIADFLLDQVTASAGPATIALPYEKALIANRLGMQPESFSRALARLRTLGVTVDRDNVRIKDLARLAEFASRSAEEDG